LLHITCKTGACYARYVPGWYLPLRRELTVVAVLSLLIGNLASL
jgi:hypothetical protein